jgi:hypothetical protein
VLNDRLVTPRGVATYITEEQAQYLRENDVFKLHAQNEFVVISDHDIDADLAAADMQGRDASAPLVLQDGIAEGDAQMVVGGDIVEPTATPAAGGRKRK